MSKESAQWLGGRREGWRATSSQEGIEQPKAPSCQEGTNHPGADHVKNTPKEDTDQPGGRRIGRRVQSSLGRLTTSRVPNNALRIERVVSFL